MGENKTQSVLEFPCNFPIKVMGRSKPGFKQLAVQLVAQHAGEIDADAVRTAPSRNGNFTALTITIVATSREQLDKIYQDLTEHEEVLMAL